MYVNNLVRKAAALKYSARPFSCSPLEKCRYQSILKWDKSLKLTTDMKQSIEERWHTEMDKYKFEEDSPKPKAYVLSMFPYPSGALHMGHVRVYTISDTIARFNRMCGRNVLHPMGWDAFGLPAENAAIERGEEPSNWTFKNIEQMRVQLKQLGCSFDWEREVCTCDPNYYKWTQKIFLMFYEAGLVYHKPALVNWDPVDKTVLADEQVDENGKSWRSGAPVEKVLLTQWFIRSTKFAKSLLDGLKTCNKQDWLDIIKLQKEWIGRTNGTIIEWQVEGPYGKLTLPIWTNEPENILRATFVAVTPGSLLDALESRSEPEKLQIEMPDGEIKVGLIRRLKAVVANPFSGEMLPTFVVEGLLPFQESTDSYIGVPTAVEVDRKFAELVKVPITPHTECSIDFGDDVRMGVIAEAQRRGLGGYKASARLKDWLISRQRYWGTPIPIVHCKSCGAVPVPEEELPIKLPPFPRGNKVEGFQGSPLSQATDWLNTVCPKCGGPGCRETDTIDTFVDSAWYYLRYIDPHNNKALVDPRKAQKFMPVDIYIGGKEHAVLHLYFARLVSHFLHQAGVTACAEPFHRLLVQGMVMGRTYRCKESGRYLKPYEVDVSGKVPVHQSTGVPVSVEWEKMSKSKHNGVDPTDMFNTYGVDTTRIQVLADVAPTSQLNWMPDGFTGTLKWQTNLYRLVAHYRDVREKAVNGDLKFDPVAPAFLEGESIALEGRNYNLGTITFNYEITYQLFVALKRMQSLTGLLRKLPNEVVAFGKEFERALAALIIVLAPMAPHFASELWQGFVEAPGRISEDSEICWDKPVLEQNWPVVDAQHGIPFTIQVNDAEICSPCVPRKELDSLDEEGFLELALQQDVVKSVVGDTKPTIRSIVHYTGHKCKIVIKAEGASIALQDINARSKSARKILSKKKRKETKMKVEQQV